jgi:hypothetical protein
LGVIIVAHCNSFINIFKKNSLDLLVYFSSYKDFGDNFGTKEQQQWEA